MIRIWCAAASADDRFIDSTYTHTHTRTHRQTAIGRQRTHLTEIGLAQRQRKALRIGKTCDSIYSSSLNNNKRTTTTIATLSCSCIRLLEKQYIENCHVIEPCMCMFVHACVSLQSLNLTLHNIVRLPHYIVSLTNQTNKETMKQPTNYVYSKSNAKLF